MSGAEQALAAALMAELAADDGLKALLGDPVRVVDGDGAQPAYPFLEFVRQSSEADGIHRIDLAVVSRNDGGKAGLAGVAVCRSVLEDAALPMEGWRCVLLVPVFTDLLRQGGGVWRCVLRLRAVVEAA